MEPENQQLEAVDDGLDFDHLLQGVEEIISEEEIDPQLVAWLKKMSSVVINNDDILTKNTKFQKGIIHLMNSLEDENRSVLLTNEFNSIICKREKFSVQEGMELTDLYTRANELQRQGDGEINIRNWKTKMCKLLPQCQNQTCLYAHYDFELIRRLDDGIQIYQHVPINQGELSDGLEQGLDHLLQDVVTAKDGKNPQLVAWLKMMNEKVNILDAKLINNKGTIKKIIFVMNFLKDQRQLARLAKSFATICYERTIFSNNEKTELNILYRRAREEA